MCLDCINAYWAGFFDGEGHIMIRTSQHKGFRPSYSLAVQISNLSKETLEKAQAKWGGNIYPRPNPKREKLVWGWQIYAQQAASFLNDIWPYTKVKHGQITAAIEFQERINNYSGPHKVTDEEIQERLRLRQTIRDLNARKYFGEYTKIKPIGGGCLDCGCGEILNNHGDPRHITWGKFRALAQLNHKSMKQTALIILATLLGIIKSTDPLETDVIEGEPKRIKVEPEKKAVYVPRIRKSSRASSRSDDQQQPKQRP